MSIPDPSKIGPCPVCGHVAELNDESDGYEAPTWYVDCAAGGCLLGPNRPTDAEAITAWNRLSYAANVLEAAIVWQRAITDLDGITMAEGGLLAALQAVQS